MLCFALPVLLFFVVLFILLISLRITTLFLSSIKYSELLYLEVHLLHVLFSIIHLIEKVSYESCKEAFSYKAVTETFLQYSGLGI